MPAKSRADRPRAALPDPVPIGGAHFNAAANVPNMTAAAQVLASGKIKRQAATPPQHQNTSGGWQSEVWALLDEIGELWFAGAWMSSALSRVRLVAARTSPDGSDPVLLDGWGDPNDERFSADDRLAASLVARFAGGPAGQSQFLARAGWHLTLAGDSYFVATDPAPMTLADTFTHPDTADEQPTSAPPLDDVQKAKLLTAPSAKHLWHAYSDQEISWATGNYRISDGSTVSRVLPDDALVIRCWRPHPRRFYEAGCATRAALPILRELRGLTMHVSAQVDSRLAGAGLLMLPQSMTFPGATQAGDFNEGEDPFVQYLMEVMLTAIRDRDSASALVPIVVKVPDDSIGKVQHLTFSSPLDQAAAELRAEALHRLSLSLDVPPEIIMGKGDTSHWNSWNVDENAINLHVVPGVATITHALTVGWLQPLLEEMGVEHPDEYLVWFDVTPLTLRPDRSTDAKELFDRTVIGSRALRRETGFTEQDAPNEEERKIELLLRIVERAPTLAPIILPLLGIDIPIPAAEQAKDTALAISGIDPVTGEAPGGGGAVDPIRDARQLSKAERQEIAETAQSRGKPTDAGPTAPEK